MEQTRAILESGKKIGLKINFHGDELNPLNSVEVRLNSFTRTIFFKLFFRRWAFLSVLMLSVI